MDHTTDQRCCYTSARGPCAVQLLDGSRASFSFETDLGWSLLTISPFSHMAYACIDGWLIQILPIEEHDKAKLLPIRSPRLRLRLVVHWIEQFNNHWYVVSSSHIPPPSHLHQPFFHISPHFTPPPPPISSISLHIACLIRTPNGLFPGSSHTHALRQVVRQWMHRLLMLPMFLWTLLCIAVTIYAWLRVFRGVLEASASTNEEGAEERWDELVRRWLQSL